MSDKKQKIKNSGLYPERHIDKASRDWDAYIEQVEKKENELKESLKAFKQNNPNFAINVQPL